MTVQTIDSTQVHTFGDHLKMAVALEEETIVAVRALARQLEGRSVLPVLGAGASHDCGLRLGSQIGADLRRDYLANPAFAPHVVGLGTNLGEVADAIFVSADQPTVVRALGLPDPVLWPSRTGIGDHFCAYRALARLAREGAVEESVTFNYDCGHEAGLTAEGFLTSPRTEFGKEWLDHATVVADSGSQAQLRRPGAFTLFKAHGCAQRYRELAVADEAMAADTIIIRNVQLATWRRDLWMRDVFRERARNHILLLIGFSGQDPVIVGTINSVLEDIFSTEPPDGIPRVVVVDYAPDSASLRTLVKLGLGGHDPAADVVAQIETSSASTTAVTLVLLAEVIALKLSQSGIALPPDIDPRLAALTVAAPIMLRWSYLLRRPAENQYVQRINLQQAAEHGYVPLTLDPQTTARALRTRVELRQSLGMITPETTREAHDASGFVVGSGCAFLPVGLSQDELVPACRPGGPIENARKNLAHPAHLDCILVSDGPGGRRGVQIDTGEEVGVP